MTITHLEDLTNQLIQTLERRGNTSRIVSAIGDALAEAPDFIDELPGLIDWEVEAVAFPSETNEAYAE